jgi:mannosyltransferase
VLIGMAIFTKRNAWQLWLALAILAFLPLLFSLLISVTIAPVFLARTLAPLSIVLTLMLALGTLRPTLDSSAVFGALLLVTGVHSLASSRLPPTENWYGAVAWLQPRLAPGDVVYAYPNEAALPFHYALRDKGIAVPIRSIPGPVPAKDPTGWYPTGSRGVVSLPQYRLDAIAADEQSQRAPTIWLLRSGASTYDKGDGFLKALSRDRTVVARWRNLPIDITGLRQSERRPSPEQSQP